MIRPHFPGVLVALAPSLADAMRIVSRPTFVILDGTLLPIDRIAADTPYHSGKHECHGMNVQVLTDPFGPAVGLTRDTRLHPRPDRSPHPQPSSTRSPRSDSSAGPTRRIRAPATPSGLPFGGRRLKRWQRRHNSTHARIRSLGEQAMATLKGRRLLRKLRCSTDRITAIVQAVLVLHRASA
ncbi:hypothetical protein GCM10010272_21820 [Streptomyces lateritius]|nr:hypothetical protein GCM10010272_21820 [Streptomyces lateritius]